MPDLPPPEGLLDGQTVLLEGRFDNPTREKMTAFLESEGATVVRDYSSAVRFVVCGGHEPKTKHEGTPVVVAYGLHEQLPLSLYDAAAMFRDDATRRRLDAWPSFAQGGPALAVADQTFEGETIASPGEGRSGGGWRLYRCLFTDCRLENLGIVGSGSERGGRDGSLDCRMERVTAEQCRLGIQNGLRADDTTFVDCSGNFVDGRWQSVEWRGKDGPTLRKMTLRHCTIADCEFPQTFDSMLTDCRLEDLRGDRFFGAHADGVRARSVRDSTLVDCVIRGAELDAIAFSGCVLERVTFEGCKLIELSMEDCRVRNCRFEDCEVQTVDFGSSEVRDCTWSGPSPPTAVLPEGGDVEGLEAGGGMAELPAAAAFAEAVGEIQLATLVLQWVGETTSGGEAAMTLKKQRSTELFGEAGDETFEIDFGDSRDFVPAELVRSLVRMFEKLDVTAIRKKGLKATFKELSLNCERMPTAEFKAVALAGLQEVADARGR